MNNIQGDLVLNQPTFEKLQSLRLRAMADAWVAQNKNPTISALSFDERFALLVDAEHQTRDNRRLTKLQADAQFRYPNACVEDIEPGSTRGMDKPLLRQIAAGGWITEHLNLIITGPTGVGKSYFGCAFGQTACRQRRRVLYRRLPRLLDELSLARADGTYARTLMKLAKTDVLILDDLGLGRLGETQRHDLLEVLEDRYGRLSTIVTSQLPHETWHEWIGDPTIADAILDRLVHNAYKINLTGPSRRKNKATTTPKPEN
jgi:DNA replication protein DnaC